LVEPQQARTKKALPIPMEKKRAKRGGRRMRKLKERFAVTELQKAQNKIQFTLDGGEYGESAMGLDSMPVMTSQGSGKVRGPQLVKSKFLQKQKKVAASSSTSGGMSSSLVFTPVQGLELVDPSAVAEKLKDVNKKWFDAHSGFVSAMPKY
jgi:U4/U6 small nuclear ribonucleoprotein PRP31